MGKTKKVENIKKYKRGLNFGIVIFLFILLYLGVLAVNYFTKSHLKIYEVQADSLAQDNIVTGLILREENVINATHSGYINYYFPDNARASKNAVLFSIDETKDYYDIVSNHSLKDGLSEYDASYLRKLIETYRKKESPVNYSAIRSFTDILNSSVQERSDAYSVSIINEAISNDVPDTFHFYYSEASGLISYNTDQLSGITLSQVRSENYDDSEDYKEYENRKSIVEANCPVIKYITSEQWQILCKLNDSQKKSLSKLDTIEFTICEDGFKTSAAFEIVEIDKQSYALIHMNDYVQNYLDERFLSIELCWQITDGFKIPFTAITQKDFFVVPIHYFSRGGDAKAFGLVIETIDPETGVATYDFKESTIYHDDGLYYYIDPSEFSYGDKVLSEDGVMYTISLTESLEGVYNINKGYAQFRRIERITQNEEYCIVKSDTEYGIKLYDHIALKASDAVDSGIIY